MRNLTTFQKITIVAFVAYLIWEIFVWQWKRTLPPSDPVIRVDLVLIYPVLAVLLVISIIQWMRKSKA